MQLLATVCDDPQLAQLFRLFTASALHIHSTLPLEDEGCSQHIHSTLHDRSAVPTPRARALHSPHSPEPLCGTFAPHSQHLHALFTALSHPSQCRTAQSSTTSPFSTDSDLALPPQKFSRTRHASLAFRAARVLCARLRTLRLETLHFGRYTFAGVTAVAQTALRSEVGQSSHATGGSIPHNGRDFGEISEICEHD